MVMETLASVIVSPQGFTLTSFSLITQWTRGIEGLLIVLIFPNQIEIDVNQPIIIYNYRPALCGEVCHQVTKLSLLHIMCPLDTLQTLILGIPWTFQGFKWPYISYIF